MLKLVTQWAETRTTTSGLCSARVCAARRMAAMSGCQTGPDFSGNAMRGEWAAQMPTTISPFAIVLARYPEDRLELLHDLVVLCGIGRADDQVRHLRTEDLRITDHVGPRADLAAPLLRDELLAIFREEPVDQHFGGVRMRSVLC